MSLDALVFDMDGTLLDTNPAHVEAWVEGLGRHGYTIPADRIGPEIGKGGDQLLPTILGERAAEEEGEEIRASVGEAFRRIAKARRFRLFDRVEELLDTLRRRGLKLALATSAKEDDLGAIMESAGTDLRRHFDAVVTKSDVEASKPQPDVVRAAVRKLGLSPAQCAMVGDTPFDATAARRAGVVTLGVLCGGVVEPETMRGRLVAAGARGSWRDPAHLLDDLDAALHTASPARARLDQALQERLMREALAVAREGAAAGEVPFGSVLADGDGRVVARAHNEAARSGNRTAHAEMVAFARAAGRVAPDACDLILVSTAEPCVMCTGAAMVGGVDTVLYGAHAPGNGGAERVTPPSIETGIMPRLVGDVLEEECRALLEEWAAANAGRPEAGEVRALLDGRRDA